jgi:hypothetical protein
MPAVFDKLGVRFMYPDNWQIDETDLLEGNNSVSVYSPGSAFWTLFVHPAGIEPESVVTAALEAMHQEYDELEHEPFHDVVGGHEVLGSDLNFYCLDLTNTAWLRSYATDEATYLVLCQADDREFEQVAVVFEAILQSLLNPKLNWRKFVGRAGTMAGGDEAGDAE